MSNKYKKFVRSLPCCHCGQDIFNNDVHHIISIGMGCMGSKAHDLHSMSLCRVCHTELHLDPKNYPQVRWMIETQQKALEAGVLKL